MRGNGYQDEEVTRPGLESDAVRQLRGGDTDSDVTVGRLMVEVIVLQKQLKEGFATFDSRMGRLEKLLYGSAGTALLAIAQFVAQKLHLIP